MTTQTPPKKSSDLMDERLADRSGVKGWIASMVDRVRAGDLGVLPVVLGVVVIWTVMQSLNDVFLSPRNLVNLTMESVPVGMIALGIVCVLLVGQIDLSVGSVSGLSAAVVAVLFVNQQLPVVVALAGAIVVGVAIGLLYSIFFIRFGVPSFVISLSGLLAFLGLQLYVLGPQGSINIAFSSPLVQFAQQQFVPATLSYVLAVLGGVALLVTGLLSRRTRLAADLSAPPLVVIVVRSVALAALFVFAVAYLNQGRGVGWMVVLFLVLVLVMHYALSQTVWGHWMYAVGGNVEAARRTGVKVTMIYTSAFVLCSSFAALGGVLAASRLAAANQSTGGGDVNLNAIAAAVIGGTSLFGGRGTAFAALLGVVVIQSISSGLSLLSLDSAFRFAITGAVLLLAVTIDSVARRSRASHGRG